MFPASEEYKEQMMRHGTRRRITGTIGDLSFTGADLVRGSFSANNRASEESNTKIGGVYLGEIELTFIPSFLQRLPRNEFRNLELSINIGLWIPDPEDDINGGAWEDIPIGVYTLQAPKISKEGITVSGYDHMQKLDKTASIDTSTATPYGFLLYICEQCGVTLANTQAEIEAMKNGLDVLTIYEPNDIETYRDMLYWLAQTLGGFATANRDGEIEIRKFGNPTGIELDEMHRDNDVVFSGYTTKWTGIYVTDAVSQTAMYYNTEPDDGLTMNLGENPFLQLGSAAAVDRRRRKVLEAITAIQYTPFTANSARDPIFDLGDEIEFTGGLSGYSTGCVMAYTYNLDNFNFEGYGDDPALASAQTKQDKNISQIKQSTTENEVTYYNFANAEAITFGDEDETIIASLAFTSAQKTTVKILHEFTFDFLQDLASGGSYELKYYLDEQLVPYSPYEALGPIDQLTEGDLTASSITRDFYYIIRDVEPDRRHTWQVRMITHGIQETTIQRNHAHITAEGQRLYSEEYYGGYIEARDYLDFIPLGYLVPLDIYDEATARLYNISKETIEDDITTHEFGSLEVIGAGGLSETVELFMESCVLASEDDAILTTEDGINLSAE